MVPAGRRGDPRGTGRAGRPDPGPAPQGQWADVLSDILNRHRENLDNAYRVGIRAIEDAFRVAEAKDPTQLLTLTEALWWRAFATLSTAAESQVRDLRATAEKLLDATTARQM